MLAGLNPDSATLWRAPRWALAFLLACLGMLGPFSIDTYLPAFTGIAQSIGATPVQMQQTLSAYLFGFAVMNLFHGALSDSFGRRPVVLWGIALFTLASAGCALSQHIGALVFFRAVQGMSPGEFFWFFSLTIAGIMGGAWFSGRLAGRIKPKHQIRNGFLIMVGISLLNLALNLLFVPQAWWALLPIAVFAFGWALMVPVVTLMVLDLVPERRGMASSCQAFIGSMANGVVAGVIAPLVMHSTRALALASLLMMSVGVFAWLWVKPRVT
jgi:MFS family permease